MFKKNPFILSSLCLLAFLAVGSVDADPGRGSKSRTASPFEIVKLKRTKTIHVDRSTLQVEYEVEVFSRHPKELRKIEGYVSSASSFVEVLDPDFEVTRVRPYKETRSNDTILVQINMRNGNLHPADLKVAFDDGSSAGFDLDGDGVRDDVELKLADRLTTELLDNPNTTSYLAEVQLRSTRQLSGAALVESYRNSARAIYCLSTTNSEVSNFLSAAELLQYNTPERVAFYKANETNMALLGSGLALGFGSIDGSPDLCETS